MLLLSADAADSNRRNDIVGPSCQKPTRQTITAAGRAPEWTSGQCGQCIWNGCWVNAHDGTEITTTGWPKK